MLLPASTPGCHPPSAAASADSQIPCFGWHQLAGDAASEAAASSSIGAEAEAGTGTGADPQEASSPDSLNTPTQLQQQQTVRWKAGDLVQLVLQTGNSTSSTRLSLRVNNQEVLSCTSGGNSGSGSSGAGGVDDADHVVTQQAGSVELPCLQDWCWYVALYRGTQVVATVFEHGSFSVYSGDSCLKRFLY